MTIRSIDMQVLVQKVGEVAKIQQAEKTSQHIKQQSFLEQIAQQTEVVSKTVNEASASEPGLIREKQSDKKKKHAEKKKKHTGKKKARQNEPDDEETANWTPDPNKGSNLDVRA